MKTPYFINPDIDALATTTGEERLNHIRRIAASVGDETALRAILGIDPEEFARFYPDMLPRELSTEDTITSFISRFSSERASETPEIEELVAAPAIDYASMLAGDDEEDTSGDVHDATGDAIANFLQAVPPKTPSRARRIRGAVTDAETVQPETPKVETTPQEPVQEEPTLSEGLFKLMVKNKNYQKALEIITELSLNNPKKSIYFAYQTRFLKKLIKNQEKQASNAGNKS